MPDQAGRGPPSDGGRNWLEKNQAPIDGPAMKTDLSPQELGNVLRQLTDPAAQSAAAEHRRFDAGPAQPHIVEIHWQLADFGIGEWFMRILKLTVATMLVGLVLSLPAWLFYAMILGSILTQKAATP